jgi:cytochrome c-type biogenesis protein CcmH/NrfG
MRKEAEDRMKRMPKHRQRRARRHKDKKQGRVPLIKVVEGTLVPGIVAYLVYAVFDYGHRLPLHLMVLASLAAVLVTTRQWEHRHSAQPRDRRGIALGLVPMLLFSLTALIAVPRYQSQHETFLAGERLEAALLEPDRIFVRPAIIHETENRYDRALRLNGSNSDAHRGKGEAILARYHADILTNSEVAAAALPVLEEAFQMNRADWKTRFALARAQLMQGEDPREGLQSLEMAMMRAPNRIEVMTLHGAMLLLDAQNPDQGVALLEEVLSREPDNPQAAELLNRYATGALADLSEEERRLSRQLLAARIGRIPILKERVLGAGRLHPDELLQQITTLSEDAF